MEIIKLKSQSIIVGDPLNLETHLGPLCTSKQIQTIEKIIAQSLSKEEKLFLEEKKLNAKVIISNLRLSIAQRKILRH